MQTLPWLDYIMLHHSCWKIPLLENTPFSPEQLLDGMTTLALVCRWVPNWVASMAARHAFSVACAASVTRRSGCSVARLDICSPASVSFSSSTVIGNSDKSFKSDSISVTSDWGSCRSSLHSASKSRAKAEINLSCPYTCNIQVQNGQAGTIVAAWNTVCVHGTVLLLWSPRVRRRAKVHTATPLQHDHVCMCCLFSIIKNHALTDLCFHAWKESYSFPGSPHKTPLRSERAVVSETGIGKIVVTPE